MDLFRLLLWAFCFVEIDDDDERADDDDDGKVKGFVVVGSRSGLYLTTG